jgi:hypothetical protein
MKYSEKRYGIGHSGITFAKLRLTGREKSAGYEMMDSQLVDEI